LGTNGGEEKEEIFGARLRLLHNKTAVLTDEHGRFELTLPKILPDTLVISAMGYYSDTLILDKKDRFISLEITLYASNLLQEVVISYQRKTHSISRMKTLHVEEISSGELRKAACCNLSESFETNASVDVNITDAVSGAKKIQMMGVDGVYTQIQMENIPYLKGLESSFGLNSISGTWIESIQITKGTGNVVNGYESMAGLVNLEIKKPDHMEKIYFNAYTNRFGRVEMNMNTGIKLSERWSVGWLVHSSKMFGEIDHNKDGFRDIPKGDNNAIMNRWAYHGKKFETQFGFNSYADNKYGGQASYYSNATGYYGVTIASKHLDLYAKTGFIMKKINRSVGVVYNFKYQTVEAKFGHRNFNGAEKRGYINAIYDDIIGNTDHRIKAGANLVYIDMLQHLDSTKVILSKDDRLEIVPGIFAEYTKTGMRLTTVLGARLDYHNLFAWQFSPRLHSKYTLTETTDLRFTAGKGWRVPNYMMDNISLLASSKAWYATQTLRPEISWNTGVSLVQEFSLFSRKASLVLDLYHTEFTNQLIVDRDSLQNGILFKNLEGRSFSNSFQSELSISPAKNLDIRVAYKLLDVRSTYGGAIQQQVMLPKHRAFINIGYKTRDKRWEYDLTCTVYGQSRLPQAILPSAPPALSATSEVYPMLNAQITHVYRKWDFYLGGENLTNYTQKNAIVDAVNPFGSTFDATRIWGPIMGINVYAGVRYAIAQPKENK
jgi:outer membrane receptor for ferrienterochelin and colicins